MAEGNQFEPPVQENNNETRNGNHSPNRPENPLQQLQVRRYCLDYLQKCRKLKRPPQSLRASGLNRLPQNTKLQTLSEAETKALCIAIQLKKRRNWRTGNPSESTK